MDGFNRFIPPKSFPAYVLNVQIDPTQIDVNVHPRKLEIRFAQEQSIFRLFYHGVKNVLEKVSLISPIISSEQVSDEIPSFSNQIQEPKTEYYTGSGTKFKSYSPYKNTNPHPKQSQISDVLDFSQTITDSKIFEKSLDLHDTPLGKIIGQMHNSYIVLETPE